MPTKPIALMLVLVWNLCACVPHSNVRTPERAPDFGVLSGIWQGSFQAVSLTPNGPAIPSQINLRLVFAGGKAQVFTREKTTWDEILPGQFSVDFLGTNALIYIVHAGRIPTPAGSRWFETYIVAVTARTSNTLLVRWVRCVNNIDTKPDDPDRAFTVDGEGILDKVSSDSIPN
jgi:hypothetical protein